MLGCIRITLTAASGDPDQALAFANAGLAKRPDYPDFLWRKSEALARLGEKDEAVVTLDQWSYLLVGD